MRKQKPGFYISFVIMKQLKTSKIFSKQPYFYINLLQKRVGYHEQVTGKVRNEVMNTGVIIPFQKALMSMDVYGMVTIRSEINLHSLSL